MSNFKKAVLKVAETNERFRKALLEEMRVAESRVPGDDSKGPEEVVSWNEPKEASEHLAAESYGAIVQDLERKLLRLGFRKGQARRSRSSGRYEEDPRLWQWGDRKTYINIATLNSLERTGEFWIWFGAVQDNQVKERFEYFPETVRGFAKLVRDTYSAAEEWVPQLAEGRTSGKTAQDNTASSKVAGMNFMDSLNRLSDKFMDEVADIVGSKLGWIRRRSGIGSYVLTGVDGKYISLSMDMHKLPFMVEVHGDVTPFKAAVYTSRDTASFILKKLGRAMKTAGEHLAAGDWVAWLEDADGYMVAFSGATSQSQAKKLQKSPKWSKIIDDGGEATSILLDRAVRRHLKPASKGWFSKLPPGDKKKLDEVLNMASGKTASSNSRDIMDAMVPRKDFREVKTALLKAKDAQTLKLLEDSYQFFFRKFELSANEERALNRLRNVMGSRSREPANLRNQIFKGADELGMRLPSGLF